MLRVLARPLSPNLLGLLMCSRSCSSLCLAAASTFQRSALSAAQRYETMYSS